MTSKERMLCAMTGGQPDIVPVAPDISGMLPVRAAGRPYWDAYLYDNPPAWQLYLEQVKKFDFDGWFIYGGLGPCPDDEREFRTEIREQTVEKIVVRRYCDTPDGTLWQERVYFRDNPEVIRTSNWVKDVDRDLPVYLKYFFPDPSSSGAEHFQAQKEAIGDYGVAGCCVNYPELGLLYIDVIDGTGYDGQRSTPNGLERTTYLYYDRHDRVEEYAAVFEAWAVAYTKRLLEASPDFLLLGNSGTLVFNSIDIFRDLALPTLRQQTRLAKEAGIPTMLHSCGNQRQLVEICANETDLDCINPLEPYPGGDCDLAEVKQTFGRTLALMGNLSTTLVTMGTASEVRTAAEQAIDAAKEGGGFILSTGDECGAETPDENIHALVETARTYGKY